MNKRKKKKNRASERIGRKTTWQGLFIIFITIRAYFKTSEWFQGLGKTRASQTSNQQIEIMKTKA
jgi:hypothetical protein